ncbi:MAG: hypothetical protein E7A62_01145 [Actinomycetaceae bacterium]|nr:hypothetical protein [Actinomycetaceae bacterium]MDU0969583.1 hypothetical protein [Actinomycetaceae bacterium]
MVNESVQPTPSDPRPPALGAARVLMAALALFTVWLFVTSIVRIHAGVTVGGCLDLVVAAVWALVTAGVIHNGRRMRLAAWAGLAFQVIALVVAAAAETAQADWVCFFLSWRGGGANYWWIPPILVVVTAVWLIVSDPRRLAGR